MTLIRTMMQDNEKTLAAMRTSANRLAIAHKEAMRARGNAGGYFGRGVSGASSTPFDRIGGQLDDSGKAKRQYEAFKDTVHTAIRPIAVKAASQPFRCGFDTKASRKSIDFAGLKTKSQKQAALESLRQAGFEYYDDDDRREIKLLAPHYIRKAIGENVEPVQEHFLMTLLQNPNEHMTGYSLKWCSFASMVLTGRYVWWFDTSGDVRNDVPELGNLRLWYLPRSWIKHPDPSDINRWQILAPGMGSGHDVTIDELFMSTMPDPGNPFMPFSALQAQAKAVDTEDKMLRAQAISMDNAMRPGMVVIAGRLPGMPIGGGRTGPGNRPILTGEQRGQLIDAIKMQFQGVQKFNEPLILDGLIEDAKPYMPSPSELDMVNSTTIFQKRIMEGIGTSPVIAGYAENANRAGSVVAKENFYENTLNPYIEQTSQDMDSVLGRRFSAPGGQRLRVWMELAVAGDPDAVLARATAFPEAITLDEKRDYMATGKLKLNKLSPAERQELVESSKPKIPKPGMMNDEQNDQGQ